VESGSDQGFSYPLRREKKLHTTP